MSTKQRWFNRTMIQGAHKAPEEEVYIPYFDAHVRVRGMTVEQRNTFENGIRTGKGKDQSVNLELLRAKLVVASAVADNGTPIFTDADIPTINQLPAVAIEPIVNVAMRLSGFTDADVKELAAELKNDPPSSSVTA